MPKSPTQMALSRKQSDPTRAAARAAARVDEDSRRTAVAAARAALEKKAEGLVVLDLRGVSGYTDFLVIGSGTSDRQLEAIADSVEKELVAQGHRLIGSEGQRGGRWVLLDFGDVVVHVFHLDEREHYDLEGLWADAPRVEVE
ncbi:MAG TPA: ribosome silencing factor [Myxococcales bacterium]|jgi:ribosome-associated protein|nr:ribosome silencing factor [Myxococcales bacterium]